MYKRLFYIGFACYFFMIVLSLLFYRERTILADSAFCLFYVLKKGGYSIELFRFTDVFAQSFPLFAYKLGLDINTVIKSYSVGFIVFFSCCYLYTGLFLKKHDYALVILLVNILFITETFYYTPSQLPQGICLLIVVFAALNKHNSNINKPINWLLLFIATILFVFYHPLVLFALIYISVFFLLPNLKKEEITYKKHIFFILIAYFIIIIFKSTVLRSVYETHSLSGLKNFIKLFPDYFTIYSNRFFIENCITKYYWIPIVTILIIITYIKLKQTKKLIFFIAFLFGYLLLINISYPSNVTPKYYIENLYLPIGLIIAMPFIFDVLPSINNTKIANALLLLIMFSFCVRVYSAHNTYTARLNWEKDFMYKNLGKKLIVNTKNVPLDTLMDTWGTPYEFWLLSASEKLNTASIVILDSPARLDWCRYSTNSVIVLWDCFPYKNFSGNKYFNFTDSVSKYTIVPIKDSKEN